MRNVRLVLAAITLAVASGCYHYVPANPTDIVPGGDVRAQLTDAGRNEMRGYFGPDVTAIEGPLVRWDVGGVALLVETYVSRPGFPPTYVSDTIRVLPQHLATLEAKELNGWRTAGLGVAILGGAVAAVWVAQTVGEGPADFPPPPPPDTMLRFRIPLRLPLRVGFGFPFF